MSGVSQVSFLLSSVGQLAACPEGSIQDTSARTMAWGGLTTQDSLGHSRGLATKPGYAGVMPAKALTLHGTSRLPLRVRKDRSGRQLHLGSVGDLRRACLMSRGGRSKAPMVREFRGPLSQVLRH